jgi:hypothetical protein
MHGFFLVHHQISPDAFGGTTHADTSNQQQLTPTHTQYASSEVKQRVSILLMQCI